MVSAGQGGVVATSLAIERSVGGASASAACAAVTATPPAERSAVALVYWSSNSSPWGSIVVAS